MMKRNAASPATTDVVQYNCDTALDDALRAVLCNALKGPARVRGETVDGDIETVQSRIAAERFRHVMRQRCAKQKAECPDDAIGALRVFYQMGDTLTRDESGAFLLTVHAQLYRQHEDERAATIQRLAPNLHFIHEDVMQRTADILIAAARTIDDSLYRFSAMHALRRATSLHINPAHVSEAKRLALAALKTLHHQASCESEECNATALRLFANLPLRSEPVRATIVVQWSRQLIQFTGHALSHATEKLFAAAITIANRPCRVKALTALRDVSDPFGRSGNFPHAVPNHVRTTLRELHAQVFGELYLEAAVARLPWLCDAQRAKWISTMADALPTFKGDGMISVTETLFAAAALMRDARHRFIAMLVLNDRSDLIKNQARFGRVKRSALYALARLHSKTSAEIQISMAEYNKDNEGTRNLKFARTFL